VDFRLRLGFSYAFNNDLRINKINVTVHVQLRFTVPGGHLFYHYVLAGGKDVVAGREQLEEK